MQIWKTIFDTSDYPVDNAFGMPQVNIQVLGLMKDEFNGKIITKFVGLRSKMYIVRVNGEDFVKREKGAKAGVIKRSISLMATSSTCKILPSKQDLSMLYDLDYTISKLSNRQKLHLARSMISDTYFRTVLTPSPRVIIRWIPWIQIDDNNDEILSDNGVELLDILEDLANK